MIGGLAVLSLAVVLTAGLILRLARIAPEGAAPLGFRVVMLGVSQIAALYPAWRAAAVNIVEAIQHE